MPHERDKAQYAQIYLFEPAEQLKLRHNSNKQLKEKTLQDIQDLLLKINPYASVLQHASVKLKQAEGHVQDLQVSPSTRTDYVPLVQQRD